MKPRIFVTILFAIQSLITSIYAQNPDDTWDSRFNTLGITGTVLSLRASGSDLYVGGSFTAVGATSASNIAKWNGTSWSVLGTSGNNGTDGSVTAIAVDGSNVYVGGSFSTAGGVSVNNIAKWDGSNWSALGSGLDGDVRAILIKASNEIFVGGFFSTAGGQSASNIAKWDGSNWSALGAGANSTVLTLAVNNDLVYAGGSFTSAGGQTTNKIAQWNTSNSTWSTLGTGMSLGDVNTLLVLGGNLYAGGLFSSAGSSSAKKIAKWDGNNWSELGTGITGGDVNAITAVSTDLYVAGSFSNAGGVSATKIAKWDGSSWSALGSGIDGGLVFALAAISTGVYAGGSFTTAGAKSSQKIALWDEGGSVPVELVSFNAMQNDNTILIEWKTVTEFNNFGFEVQRKIINTPDKTSNPEWLKIAFIKGHGTTTETKNYRYSDALESGQIELGALAQYRLKQIDTNGSFEFYGPVEVYLNNLPADFNLKQNYPNPFNPVTVISFKIPVNNFTTLKVYDVTGKETVTILASILEANKLYTVEFNAVNYASGLYYYILRSGSLVETKKMLLIK